MVWVHSIPDTSGIADPTGFGANYPLYYMHAGSGSPADRARVNVADAVAAGVDGINVNVFLSHPGALAKWMDPYLTAADRTSLLVAPTVNLATATTDNNARLALATTNMLHYCVTARAHRSAAVYDGRLVAFAFSANLAAPSFWSDLKQNLAARGCATYFVLNVPQSYCGADKGCYRNYLSATDRAWNFSGLDDDSFAAVQSIYRLLNRPFIGGIWPRLFASSHGTQRLPIRARPADPSATSFYRDQWQTQLAANLPWMSVSTLDDFVEHTNIDPSSDWNRTLTDLTAWYAARYRATAPPFATARSYVTTPQALYAGQSAPAEALLLNASAAAATVRVQVLDAEGRSVGPSVNSTAAAGALAAASAAVTCPTGSGRSTWFRARMTTPGGSEVLSAPVLCYAAAPPADRFVLYYSVPAGQALTKPVSLTADGDRLSVTTGGVLARFTEVLDDTQSVGNTFAGPITARTPQSLPLERTGPAIDNRGDNRQFGLYVARVIDSSGHVGYSDPVVVR